MRLHLLPAAFASASLFAQIPDHYYRTFSHDNPVFKRIKPGEVIVTKTLDSGGKNFHSEQSSPGGNPLTGPFYIEGAEAGDAVLVKLRKVRLNRNWGTTTYRLGLYSLTPDYVETIFSMKGRDTQMLWDLDLASNTVGLHKPVSTKVKLEFPARPMLGCIGVAAPGDFSPTSGPAGNYGGNMDYNEVGEGATLILPVFHPGALLYIGDGHGLMADGEPTGTGVETSMDVSSPSIRKRTRTSPGRGLRPRNI